MKKVLVMLIVPMFFISCSALQTFITKKPEISLKRFDIDSISLKDITFVFEIELNNPYPVGFRLEDVGFNVKVDDNQIFKTRTKKGITVASGGREVTPLKVKLVYEDIMRVIKSYSEKDYLNCVIDIDTVIPLPEMVQSIKKSITFNYTVQKKIPALMPTFKIAHMSVNAPSLDDIKRSMVETGKKNLDPNKLLDMFEGLISGRKADTTLDLTSLDVPISISFDIEVRNNTKARLQCRDLAYDFFVNDVKILNGITGAVVNEGNLSVIRITNNFSSKALGTSVVRMFETRNGGYRLMGYSNVKFPNEIKSDPLRLAFNEKGTFSLK